MKAAPLIPITRRRFRANFIRPQAWLTNGYGIRKIFPALEPFQAQTTDRADLQEVHAHVLYNHPSGIFALVESGWHRQDNQADSTSLKDDSFVQLNFFLGYRFPRQRGEVRVGLMNITDQDYRLNPLNVYEELPRERVFFARLRFRF